MNTRIVSMTANVCQLFNLAKNNAEPRPHAGNSALPRRETAMLWMLPSVLLPTTASESKPANKWAQLLLPSMMTQLLSVSRRNAQRNIKNVSKIPNVSQPSKSVKRNAEPNKPVGNSVLPVRETVMPQTLPNVLLLTNAFDLIFIENQYLWLNPRYNPNL